MLQIRSQMGSCQTYYSRASCSNKKMSATVQLTSAKTNQFKPKNLAHVPLSNYQALSFNYPSQNFPKIICLQKKTFSTQSICQEPTLENKIQQIEKELKEAYLNTGNFVQLWQKFVWESNSFLKEPAQLSTDQLTRLLNLSEEISQQAMLRDFNQFDLKNFGLTSKYRSLIEEKNKRKI